MFTATASGFEIDVEVLLALSPISFLPSDDASCKVHIFYILRVDRDGSIGFRVSFSPSSKSKYDLKTWVLEYIPR
jgi:hypothetical protein